VDPGEVGELRVEDGEGGSSSSSRAALHASKTAFRVVRASNRRGDWFKGWVGLNGLRNMG